MSTFEHIGVIVKNGDPRIHDTVSALLLDLRNRAVTVHLDQSLGTVGFADAQLLPRNALGEQCDLVIVVGGDGTLLDAARSLAHFGIPLLGVNVGRLGFLVDIYPEDMPAQLDAVFSGQYQIEYRNMLHGRISRGDVEFAAGVALNDVVIHSDEAIRMIEFDTRIDGQLVNHQRADGIIVSTPTGSTAYALSGGGPILQPGIEAVSLVPICPHTLSSRPIVVNADSEITLLLSAQSRTNARVAFDGHLNIKIQADDVVTISPYAHRMQLIHPKNHDYYAILRKKLRWSEQP